MIAYLKGKIVEIGETYVVVNVGGIGYKVYISHGTEGWEGLVEDSDIEVFTSQYFRENEQGLYGFPTPQERNFYELLTTVSGVGPKLASTILSKFDSEDIANLIVKEDIVGIVQVPGIGKKVAEKIIVELRDKALEYSDELPESKGVSKKWKDELEFLAQALRKLGFNNKEVSEILDGSGKLLESGKSEEEVLSILLSESVQ
jgi:Holliday junction DNA helicase RuvA